ncbi:MAG: hypothetical protein AAF368_06045, partial [Planctomycetota bacterium]
MRNQQNMSRAQAEQKVQSVKTQFDTVQNELREDVQRLEPAAKEAQIKALQDRLANDRQRSRQRQRSRDGPSLER